MQFNSLEFSQNSEIATHFRILYISFGFFFLSHSFGGLFNRSNPMSLCHIFVANNNYHEVRKARTTTTITKRYSECAKLDRPTAGSPTSMRLLVAKPTLSRIHSKRNSLAIHLFIVDFYFTGEPNIDDRHIKFRQFLMKYCGYIRTT